MRRWLARLSFSFFIVAAVLVWEAYKLSQGAGDAAGGRARMVLYTLGAAAAFAAGLAGVRERHRPDDRGE